MRFHMLGVGSIGSLVGFHLKRSIRAQRNQLDPPSKLQMRKQLLLSNLSNDPQNSLENAAVTLPATEHIPPHVRPYLPDPRNTSVTLHVRERLFAKQISKRVNNTITLERDGVRAVENKFNVERTSAASSVVAQVVSKGNSDRIQLRREGPSGRTYPYAVPDRDGGVSVISTMDGVHHDPQHAPIDTLIVTTKCDVTLPALTPLLPRLHPWSTVVLIQNGMGVADTLIERLFQDPEKRPNFILATTTHGVFRKAPLHAVHAGMGELHFSVVPNARAGSQGFEKALSEEMAQRWLAWSESGKLADSLPSLSKKLKDRYKDSGWDGFDPTPEEGAGEDGAPPPPKKAPQLLDVEGIPDVPSLRTLRHTVSTLLSLPLNVHWISVREYQLKAMRKLAINACINPLTALADCRNGDLFGNSAAQDAMWSVCLEVAAVLEAQIRQYLETQEEEDEETTTQQGQGQQQQQQQQQQRGGRRRGGGLGRPASVLPISDLIQREGPDGKPCLDPSLTAESLYHETQRAIRLTAGNWSSMHADVQSMRGSTEIDYINGYIAALGRGYDVSTPANDMLTSLVRLKSGRLTSS